MSHLKDKIKQALTAYYSAIQENNFSIARPYLTSRLIAKLEENNRENLSEGIKFYFKHHEINSIEFVSAQRGQEGSKDRLWVLIKFSMIRYWVDSTSGQEIEGNAFIPQTYIHLCNFVCTDQNWLADRIDGYSGVMDIVNIFPIEDQMITRTPRLPVYPRLSVIFSA
jgi:hypothetical protein